MSASIPVHHVAVAGLKPAAQVFGPRPQSSVSDHSTAPYPVLWPPELSCDLELRTRRSPSALILPRLFPPPFRVVLTAASGLAAVQALPGLPSRRGSPHGRRLSTGTRALKRLCLGGRPGPRGATSLRRPLHPLPSTVHPRPRGKASRRPGCDGTGLAANQRRTRPPTPSPSHPQLFGAAELVLSPVTHEETTLTFRVRHVAPHSVRAAWATTEGASTDSRRPQAAPLKPAHLCDAGCVLRRGTEGRGQARGGEPEARAGRLRNFIGWLAPPPPSRGSASARALWHSPGPRLPGLETHAQPAPAAHSLWAWPRPQFTDLCCV